MNDEVRNPVPRSSFRVHRFRPRLFILLAAISLRERQTMRAHSIIGVLLLLLTSCAARDDGNTFAHYRYDATVAIGQEMRLGFGRTPWIIIPTRVDPVEHRALIQLSGNDQTVDGWLTEGESIGKLFGPKFENHLFLAKVE